MSVKHIKGVVFILVTAMLSGMPGNTVTVNIDADIQTKTRYVDCQPLAEQIVELVKLYAKDDTHKDDLAREIKKKKKKLKRCEKNNKDNRRRRPMGINSVTVGVGTRF